MAPLSDDDDYLPDCRDHASGTLCLDRTFAGCGLCHRDVDGGADDSLFTAPHQGFLDWDSMGQADAWLRSVNRIITLNQPEILASRSEALTDVIRPRLICGSSGNDGICCAITQLRGP